jgi:8-oxo-dGTP pyrophosphatase MutT (NUDIX family)
VTDAATDGVRDSGLHGGSPHHRHIHARDRAEGRAQSQAHGQDQGRADGQSHSQAHVPAYPAARPAGPDGSDAADGGDRGEGAAEQSAAGQPVPTWLRDLAAAARHMPVAAQLRPPRVGGRASAVLVLFGAGPAGPDVLLIKRSVGLRRHAGQTAFPGGAIDSGDTGPVAAALREAVEETGLDPAGVEVVGGLPELFVARSGFRVTPVLAWWRRPSPVGPADPAEVAAVARVRLADLAEPANRFMVRHPSGLAGPAFRVSGLLVWGFTAGILDRLLATAQLERPWDRARVEDLPPSVLD